MYLKEYVWRKGLLSTMQSRLPLKKKPLENIKGKKEMLVNSISPFPTKFTTLSKSEVVVLATSNLLFANAFNVVKAKILSFGTDLILYHTIPTFNNRKEAL